jgi:hypothetical protein
MLIEGASTRLAIDLLESLRKHKFDATDIRVSYISKGGNTSFRTFNNIEELKDFYQKKYGLIVSSRRNPFTTDKKKAQLTPLVKNGLIIGVESTPVNNSNIVGICELGLFLSVERFRLVSTTFNYDVEFNCQDVSDVFKIIEGKSQDIRRNTSRKTGLLRQESAITKFIKDYQKILNRLFKAYNANLYVDLCYVSIGYVEESILLYSIFFALVKERIDSGLRLSVLEPRYLKKNE